MGYTCCQLCLSPCFAYLLPRCSYVANISCCRYTPYTLRFWFLYFLSFLFSFLIFCLSFFLSLHFLNLFPPMPTATKSTTFWLSLWVNKDEILIESIFCFGLSSFPLIFRILSDSSNLLFHSLFLSLSVCLSLSLSIYIYIESLIKKVHV